MGPCWLYTDSSSSSLTELTWVRAGFQSTLWIGCSLQNNYFWFKFLNFKFCIICCPLYCVVASSAISLCFPWKIIYFKTSIFVGHPLDPILQHADNSHSLLLFLSHAHFYILLLYYYHIFSCSNPNLLCFSSCTGSSTPLTILLVLLLDFISFTVTFKRQDHQICTQKLRYRSTLEKWGWFVLQPFPKNPYDLSVVSNCHQAFK